MTDGFRTLPDMLDTAWRRLEDTVSNSLSQNRFPVLATVGADGGAEARMIVARACDRRTGTVSAFTDSATAKVQDIASEPRATLLFWDPELQFQIRLRGQVSAAKGDPDIWQSLPAASKAGYGPTPSPGQPLSAPEARDVTPDPDRFLALTFTIREIETLRLERPHHRRARYRRADGWQGQWIAP